MSRGLRAHLACVLCFALLPAVAQVQLPDAVVGRDYSVQLPASGGIEPYHWRVGDGVPPGLRLSATGLLHGRPTAAGEYDFTVRLADAADAVLTETLLIQVTEVLPERLPLELPIDQIPDAMVGRAYETVIPVEGGVPPYTFQLRSLPAGLKLEAGAGRLSGTLAEPGDHVLEVVVSDAQSPPGTAAARLRFAVYRVEFVDEPALAEKLGELPRYLFLALVVAAYFLLDRFVLEARYGKARKKFLHAGGELQETEEGVFLRGDESARETLMEANEQFRRHRSFLRIGCGLIGLGFLAYVLS